ncbi:MAG: RNA polymerase subunit sigma-24 [Rhodopirellula sp.]|nr:RNA polymerase subunit sigma-24 [Rhodopirellula sp.]
MGLDPKLQEYVDEIIRHKARQLSRKPGFSPSDQEDIEHELFIAILERWPSFDSKRASARTFVARVVASKAVSLVRTCQAAKRGVRQSTSLNGDATNGAFEFDEDQVRARRGIHSRSDVEAVSLRLDVAGVVADLPDDLRRLCERLLRESVSEAARSSGQHRTTLYRAISDLRKRFTESGLHEYL